MSVRPKDRQQSIAELRGSLLGEGDAKTATLAGAAPSRPANTVTTSGGWNRIPPPASAQTAAKTPRMWPVAVAAAIVLLLGGAGWAMFEWRSQQTAEVARIETERLRREAAVKADADRRRLESERQKIEAERQRQADEAERLKREALERERQKAEPSRQQPQQGIPGGRLATLIEGAMGPCTFCDDVRKITTESEFGELTGLPAMIERTIADIANRRGSLEDVKGRTYLDLLAKAALDPDPYAAIKAGNVRCTTYYVGFLDFAVQRGGEHQCIVRMVLIGGELTSLTIEKTSGDGFHANVKRFRVNAPAFLGRTYLKGHAVTRYNQAQPFNKENRNFGNKVGLLVSLGGKPVLLSMNQNGFTEPDSTFFEMMVLE